MINSQSLFDAVIAVVLVASQLVFLLGTYRFSRRLTQDRLTLRICRTVLLSWSSIVVVATVLGTLSILWPWLFYFCLSIIGVLFYIGSASFPESAVSKNELPVQPPLWKKINQIAWMLFGAFIIAYVLRYGIFRLPNDWDSLAYHIPIIDHWIQHSSLLTRDCAFWYVPGNNELIGYWLVAGQSGDFWIGLNNLPVVILLVCSCIEIMIALGIRWNLRFICVLAITASEVFTRQLISQENDLAAGVLFVSAILFGWRMLDQGKRFDAVLFFMSLGLLVGIKYFALIYAVAAFASVALFVWSKQGHLSVLKISCGALLAVFCLAGFWYLRNWAYTGTPLFPKGFEWIGMPDQWSVMRPGNEYSTLLRGGTLERFGLLAWAWLVQAGPASLTAIVVSPAVIIIGCFGRLCRNRTLSVLLAVSVVATLAVYVNTPNVIESVFGTENMIRSQYHAVRFGTPVAVMTTIGCVAMLNRIPHKITRLILIGIWSVLVSYDVLLRLGHQLGLSAYYKELHIKVNWPRGNPADPLILGILFVLLVIAYMLIRNIKFSRHSRKAIVTVAILIVLPISTYFISTRWHHKFDEHFSQRPLFGESVEAVAKHVSDSDLLCVCVYRYYPFLGSDRSRRVVRPLYMVDDESILISFQKSQATHILCRMHDSHETQSYSAVLPFLLDNEEAFPEIQKLPGFKLMKIDLTQLPKSGFTNLPQANEAMINADK